MQRRDYLLASAALTFPLAGCTGDEDTAPAPAEDDEDTPTEADGGTPTDDGEQTTEEPTPTETETPESGEAEVVIDEAGAELGIDESGYGDDVYVAVDLVNQGDAVSGEVQASVDWLDENGEYLDDSSTTIASLNPGETWSARVYALAVDEEKIDGFDVFGAYDVGPLTVPDGIELVSSELLTGQENVKVRGEVENNMDVTADYLAFHGKVYNDAGEVLGEAWTNETDVPSGQTWRADPEWRNAGDRASDAVDHEVVLEASVY